MNWLKMVVPQQVVAGVKSKSTMVVFTCYSKKSTMEDTIVRAGGHVRLGSRPDLDPGSLWHQLQDSGVFGIQSLGWMQ